MRRIFKYQPMPDGFYLLPEGAKIIHAAIQGHALTLWAEVDPEASMIRAIVTMHPTGGEIPEGAEHLDTLFPSPGLVFHSYLMREEKA